MCRTFSLVGRTVQHSADACQKACAKPGCYEEELRSFTAAPGRESQCRIVQVWLSSRIELRVELVERLVF